MFIILLLLKSSYPPKITGDRGVAKLQFALVEAFALSATLRA